MCRTPKPRFKQKLMEICFDKEVRLISESELIRLLAV